MIHLSHLFNCTPEIAGALLLWEKTTFSCSLIRSVYDVWFCVYYRPKTMSDHQDQAEDVGLLTPHDQSEPSKDDDMHFRQVMT